MHKIRGLAVVMLTALAVLAYSPAFAEETADSTEVFINSNALNSTVTIESEGETVSGPGNKVLANLEDGSTFDVTLSPAEGSEVMAFTMKANNLETGEVTDLAPVDQEGNTYSYQLPESGKYKVTGETYFGDPATESTADAAAEAENSAMDKIAADQPADEGAAETQIAAQGETSDEVQSTETPDTAAADETSAQNAAQDATDSQTPAELPESQDGPSPKTGNADTGAVAALSLLGIFAAAAVRFKIKAL